MQLEPSLEMTPAKYGAMSNAATLIDALAAAHCNVYNVDVRFQATVFAFDLA